MSFILTQKCSLVNHIAKYFYFYLKLKIISQKNIELMQKFNHITKPSTKDKVLAYLQYVSKKQNSKYFDIPFNRQELAEYLSVDRSALSYELCKLRDKGILDFNKNHFMLK